jgi:hypothetical protein
MAPRQLRQRVVTRTQVLGYLAKAEEYLSAAVDSLAANRTIAATSLAIHAGINAADVVTGARLGVRAAEQEHGAVLGLLGQAGTDGVAVSRELTRLLPLKTRAEYDPDDVPSPTATRAVEQARRCVAAARRATGGV